MGLEITLHVFEYGRGKQAELNKYAKVIYYSRKRSVLQQFSWRPFIVQSRKNKFLLENLLADNAPILFEGIHTTYYLENESIQKRLTMVRMHNLEHEYYRGLKKNASWLKRIFFQIEAEKLKKYQKTLTKCTHVLAIKEEDAQFLRKIHPNVSVLPASIPDLKGHFGSVGRYALFHGNLSVPENVQAVRWINDSLKPVLESSFELIIAGKNPSKKLKQFCHSADVKLVPNPSEIELNNLIQGAKIHVLYTRVEAGIKLKLLACLHSSGHILLNDKMMGGGPFEPFCTVANTAKEFKLHFIGLQNKALEKIEFDRRQDFLNSHFNNELNCSIILKMMKDENS